VRSSEKLLLSLGCHRITMVQPAESRKRLNLAFTRRANFCSTTCCRVLHQSQYKRNPARCQFTTVLGVTKMSGLVHPDQNVLSATQNSLCRQSIDGEVVARAEPAIADGEPGFQGRGPHGNGKR
jgi:hypothetical protein